MAARPLLLDVASAARSGALSLPVRIIPKRTFQLSAAHFRPTTATSLPSLSTPLNSQVPPSGTDPPQAEAFGETQHAAFLGEADSNTGHDAVKDAHGAPEPPLEAENSAYLGEADSDDHSEVSRVVRGDEQAALDAQHAAFLGEADSNDGFEAQRAADGDKHEAMDASNAAFLGEADGDDAHEADFDINPEKHRHRIEDTSASGLHGQHGEHDQ